VTSKRIAAGIVCVAIFTTQFAALDLLLRRPRLSEWLACAAASVALWALVASFAEKRAARIVFSLIAALLLVVQVVFFRYYHVFLDDQALGAARHMWGDVKPVVGGMLPKVVGVTAAVAVLEYEVLAFSVRAKRAIPRVVLALAFVGGVFWGLRAHAMGPDLSAITSVRAFARTPEPRAATTVQVPTLGTKRARVPNVLFILDESVRASDYDQATAPETAALTKGRIDLKEMRSVASYTAIAVSALLTSRAPTETEDELQHAPCLFDFARAVVSVGGRVHVGYFSSQTDSLFERRDIRAATDVFVTVDDLVGHKVDDIDDVIDQGVDRKLALRVETELENLPKPFLAMVHLSGTHAPYFVDDERAPFRPYRHTVTWSGLGELHAAYRDAIYEQDRSVARVLRSFFAVCGADPCVVVFTSDHGEAFGEHSAIHHGQSLYDEQIHVPAWVYVRGGALDPNEMRVLVAHEKDFVTHLDVLPTILDVLGVLDANAMTAFAPKLGGRTLLRASEAPAIVPITNCTDMFPCPVKTWGLLSGGRALLSQQWDSDWRCVDLRTDLELTSDPTCALLRTSSRDFYPTLPNGVANH
jgi:hypothetical protein